MFFAEGRTDAGRYTLSKLGLKGVICSLTTLSVSSGQDWVVWSGVLDAMVGAPAVCLGLGVAADVAGIEARRNLCLRAIRGEFHVPIGSTDQTRNFISRV